MRVLWPLSFVVRPGEPKVSQLDATFHGDEDVGWLQVAVKDATAMASSQPTQDLLKNALNSRLIQCTCGILQQLIKIRGAVLQHHGEGTALWVEVIQTYNVGVLKALQGLNFSQHIVRKAKLRLPYHNSLQCDKLPGLDILRALHLPKRTVANAPHDSVLRARLLARERGQLRNHQRWTRLRHASHPGDDLSLALTKNAGHCRNLPVLPIGA
mmetsp:Transcript_18022/g.32089  ORF Transcript_18022/g.32089 Transcript_18022/m.32089 type:complete len:212 (+) Transcript_18022:447-1082(+)